MKKIGYIGLGKMGGTISKILLESGYKLFGFDPNKKACKTFTKMGGTILSSPKDIANQTEIVLASLPNDDVVREVIFGKNGISLTRKKIIFADLSTVYPEITKEIASTLQKKSISYLDATVSGNPKVAKRKELVLMCGGKKNSFNTCLPIFRTFTKKQFYMGSSGSGSLMKMVVNTISEINRTAIGEGFSLGKKGGLKGETMIEVLKEGAAYSKQMDLKGDRILHSDYTSPESTIQQCIKTANQILKTANELDHPIPMTALRTQLYQAVASMGHANDDSSSIAELFNKMSGIKK